MGVLVGSVCRAASRRDGEPLNILSFPTHEAYQTALAATGHRFFLVQGPGIKSWNKAFRPVPPGTRLLDASLGSGQIPPEFDYDLVLSQNKFGQFEVARQLATQLHLPLVSLEHCLPPPTWGEGQLERCRRMRGDMDVFISEYSRGRWGWPEAEGRVVHHGIDTALFAPQGRDRLPVALSVVNDWANRDWCCGYELWRKGTQGVQTRVLGDTPGLSRPAGSVRELVDAYASALVFVNTSLVSPIPTALLEAMSSGCAVVTTSNCMIGDVVKDGVNGLLADTPAAISTAVKRLFFDRGLAARLGEEARKTVQDRFSLARFTRNWDFLLREAAEIVFTGEGR